MFLFISTVSNAESQQTEPVTSHLYIAVTSREHHAAATVNQVHTWFYSDTALTAAAAL